MMERQTHVSVDKSTCLSVGVRTTQGNVEKRKQVATAAEKHHNVM